MTDFISRDVAVNGIAKIINDSDMPEDWNKGMSAAMLALFRIPAADVRPVVLCRDCRHRDPEDHKCDCGQLERAGCVFPVDDDYYCAYGVKREEN